MDTRTHTDLYSNPSYIPLSNKIQYEVYYEIWLYSFLQWYLSNSSEHKRDNASLGFFMNSAA